MRRYQVTVAEVHVHEVVLEVIASSNSEAYDKALAGDGKILKDTDLGGDSPGVVDAIQDLGEV